MRYLLSLIVAICTLLAISDSHAAPMGDRIVIFRDSSDAFIWFERSVLYDPEVMSLINQNFEVYSLEAGGSAARAMPLVAGNDHGPRIVVVSPRLDNLVTVMSPDVQKAHFLALLRAVKQSTNRQELDLLLARST